MPTPVDDGPAGRIACPSPHLGCCSMPPIGKNVQVTLVGLAALYAAQVASPPFDAYVRSHLLVSAWNVVGEYEIWTVLTFSLWHGSHWHLLINGATLFFFAGYLEAQWSTRQFWAFCLACAIGSGLAVVASQLLQALLLHAGFGFGATFTEALRALSTPTIGYSGVVVGLLGAFAYLMWDREFPLFGYFVTGKLFFWLLIGVDVLRVCGGSNVSFSGHMGGLLVGFALTHWVLSDGTGGSRRTSQKANDYQRHLLSDAREALAEEDWREAYRLCHQLRSRDQTLPADIRDDVWEILGISATHLEKFDEADSYLDRAPDTEAVAEARTTWRESHPYDEDF